MQNKLLLFIIFCNLCVATVAQLIGWYMPNKPSIVVLFIATPLTLAMSNYLLHLSKRAPFHYYVIGAYTGYGFSLISLAFLVFDHTKELPPGEIILFADVLFFFILIIPQLLLLFSLHIFFYVLAKRKNHPSF